MVRAVQAAPLLAGRLAQLEDHSEGRIAAEAALGLGGPEAHGRKGALYGVRRSDVLPVLGRKIVESQQNVPVLGQAGDRLVVLGSASSGCPFAYSVIEGRSPFRKRSTNSSASASNGR